MKFKVREGFVVHHSQVVELDIGGGEVRRETQTNTYYQGQVVDFTAEEAEEHLHKLEPADKDAAKYVEARFVPSAAPPVAAGGIDPDVFARAVAAAVAQALAAQQLTAPAA